MNRRGGVTIEDVAAAVGVSRQTVSRVINDGPNVKPAVRERIEAAIAQLGYVPNLSARRMGGGRSFLIMAINDRSRTLENWQAGRGNDWVDQMLYGGMTECELHGYHLVFELVDTDEDAAHRQISRALASLRPDGVILTPPHCDNGALVALLAQRGIPCARIGHHEGRATVDVYMDEVAAAQAATDHLLDLGHTRLAFVAGAPNYGSSALREEGFRAAIRMRGLPASAGSVANGDFHFDTAAQVIEAELQRPDRPTALIADNDEMAFAALHVSSQLGLSVPRDLAVISFEDTPGVRFSVPPLTAVRQPVARMIGTACQQLIAAGGGDAVCGSFAIPFDLIVRASTVGLNP